MEELLKKHEYILFDTKTDYTEDSWVVNDSEATRKATDLTVDTAIEFGKWIAVNVYRFIPNYKGVDKTTWWDDGDLNNKKNPDPISTEELFNIFLKQRT